MISDNIQKQIQDAMKSGDELRKTTLKLLSTAFHNAEIDKKDKLSEAEEVNIVQQEVKRRLDAIELYKKGGATEKANREEAEIKILKEFLPKEMSEKQLEKVVEETIEKTGASDMKDMGKVIGVVKSQVGARAQGSDIARVAKDKLS